MVVVNPLIRVVLSWSLHWPCQLEGTTKGKVRQIMRHFMGAPGDDFGDEEANTEAIVAWIAELLEEGKKFPNGLFGQIKTRANKLAISGNGLEKEAIVAAAKEVYQEYKKRACAVWSVFV